MELRPPLLCVCEPFLGAPLDPQDRYKDGCQVVSAEAAPSGCCRLDAAVAAIQNPGRFLGLCARFLHYLRVRQVRHTALLSPSRAAHGKLIDSH